MSQYNYTLINNKSKDKGCELLTALAYRKELKCKDRTQRRLNQQEIVYMNMNSIYYTNIIIT